MIKKILLLVSFLVDLYFLYATIGYFLQGYHSPTLYGNSNTFFFGNYLLAISFAVLFLLLSTLITVYLFILKKKTKRG